MEKRREQGLPRFSGTSPSPGIGSEGQVDIHNNGPFRGFHIAPCKGGEWARNIAASSTPPSVNQAGEALCRISRLITMDLVV